MSSILAGSRFSHELSQIHWNERIQANLMGNTSARKSHFEYRRFRILTSILVTYRVTVSPSHRITSSIKRFKEDVATFSSFVISAPSGLASRRRR